MRCQLRAQRILKRLKEPDQLLTSFCPQTVRLLNILNKIDCFGFCPSVMYNKMVQTYFTSLVLSNVFYQISKKRCAARKQTHILKHKSTTYSQKLLCSVSAKMSEGEQTIQVFLTQATTMHSESPLRSQKEFWCF